MDGRDYGVDKRLCIAQMKTTIGLYNTEMVGIKEQILRKRQGIFASLAIWAIVTGLTFSWAVTCASEPAIMLFGIFLAGALFVLWFERIANLIYSIIDYCVNDNKVKLSRYVTEITLADRLDICKQEIKKIEEDQAKLENDELEDYPLEFNYKYRGVPAVGGCVEDDYEMLKTKIWVVSFIVGWISIGLLVSGAFSR
jgi:hypothetical protein